MRSADALIAFEDHLRSLDLAVYDLEARSAINAMLTFYAGNRAEDVAPETDGDMLLFQWASLKRRPGPGFEYNITRQLITLPGDEEDIWQLSLTLYFSSTARTHSSEAEIAGMKPPTALMSSRATSTPTRPPPTLRPTGQHRRNFGGDLSDYLPCGSPAR